MKFGTMSPWKRQEDQEEQSHKLATLRTLAQALATLLAGLPE